MKVVEYWHGTIKNYRYDGDVSPAFSKGVARSAHRPPTQRAGVPGAMAYDPWGHRFSPAC